MSDWWVRTTGKDDKREAGLLEWLPASIYFLPHVLFRLIALSLIFAISGFYSIAIIAIMALLAILLALPVIVKLMGIWPSFTPRGPQAQPKVSGQNRTDKNCLLYFSFLLKSHMKLKTLS